MSDVKFNPATLARVLVAPDTPDNKLDMVFYRGVSTTESTSHLVSEGQSNNNEQDFRGLASSDITVVAKEGAPTPEAEAGASATGAPKEDVPATGGLVTDASEEDKSKEDGSEAEEDARVAASEEDKPAADTSVVVIAGSDTNNKKFQAEVVDFYDKIIDAKTKKMSTNRHDRVYSRIFAAVSAILAVASVAILIAAWIVLPVGLLITLIFIVTVSFMLLSLSALDSATKTGQIKSSAEQVLVARILKEIYKNPSIESEIDYNDKEFQQIHHFINEFLEGSIPAGYIESKELLDTLGNGKATKEDLDRCICRTLSKFIFLRNPYGSTQEKFESSQIYRHLKLLLDNSSLKEELVLALDPKNITMQPISFSE